MEERLQIDIDFQDACKDLEIVPQIPNLDAIPLTYREDVLKYYKELVIADALLLKLDEEFQRFK